MRWVVPPGGSAGTAQTILWLFMVLGAFAPGAWAQADVQGQWSTLVYLMPINPIHAALLHNGKILVVAGSGNCAPGQPGCPTSAPYGPPNNSGALVLDTGTGSITGLTVSWDMFCNSMTALADGRVLVNGGNLDYRLFGSPRSSIFDPSTNSFTDQPNMAHGRWYPSVVLLRDGRVMTFSGSDEATGATNTSVEIFTVGQGWSSPVNAGWTPALYPRLHLLPSGNVFYAGPSQVSYLFNVSSETWTAMASSNFGSRTYGSSVLLPLTPANSYNPRVMILGGNSPSTATTELIDLGAGSPTWGYGPDMSQPRIEMDAVMLPTGKILAIGGSASDEDATTASLNADLYDPNTNSFSSAGQNAYPRLYHTTALLLPDATVWLAGGNPARGTYEQHMEIYEPAYLFTRDGGNNVVAATRPTIASAPSDIAWGGPFTVSTPDAASISQVVLVRPGSSTHAFDMDQRLVGMSFTAGSSALTVTAPPNSNVAPPGYYMLFILNGSGVPSIASFVFLSSSGPAPTVSSVSPNSGSVSGGTTLTIVGTNFAPGATVSFAGTVATDVTVVSSTSITATTPPQAAGAVSVRVTNPDSQSSTLANGYTYTSPNPAPALTAITPNAGPASGGTGVTITGANFLTGATVSFAGTAATGVTVVSSTSITATTPPLAVGAVSVMVTNPDSQSGTLANGYTYTSPNPAPALTAITPNAGPASGGTGVTITGANFLTGATVSFAGTAATGAMVVNSTSITATTPVHEAEGGVATVMVTNPDGQIGTLTDGYTYISPNPGSPGLGLSVASGSSASATVVAGQTASYTLSIGGAGVSGTATLSCTGAPMGAKCSLPASEPISSTVPGTFAVSVSTTSRTLGALHPPVSLPVPWVWTIAALGIVSWTGMRGRRWSVHRCVRLAPLLLLLLSVSCGGGSSTGGQQPNPNGTPAGTYTLTVNATVDSATASTSLTLIVQ
jgi:hypothetical protein